MEIVRYTPDKKAEWDNFVKESKNGTFLFRRDYMEYHADRFFDFSWIVYDDQGNISALFPANIIENKEVRSHGGLTYGGLIMNNRTSAAGHCSPLHIFPALFAKMRSQGATLLIYKPVPHIYHRQPAEEDLYALWRLGARLEWRTLASVIHVPDAIRSSRLGKRALKRQHSFGIEVTSTDRAIDFWQIIVDDRMERHNTTPVHSCAEMQLLRDRFPDDIRFFVAKQGDETLAGAIIYVANGVLHLQYAAATTKGKDLYAVDIIYHHLIFNIFTDAQWFDFGTSNEDSGRYLNEGMVAHKEEFGARSILYDAYRIDL